MPFVINPIYDASVTDLQTTNSTLYSEYTGAVQAAIGWFEQHIATNITININFGWGEVATSPIDPTAAGESITPFDNYLYSDVLAALKATDTTSTVQATAVATLPNVDPTGGANFRVSYAEQMALGLWDNPFDDAVGSVGISSALNWTWTQTGAFQSNSLDAVGVLEHEISEVLGRTAEGGAGGAYTVLDLFRYTSADGGADDAIGAAAGVRDQPFVPGYNGNAPSYFSYDGLHVTQMFETPTHVTNGADVADWAPSMGFDAFGDAPAGAPLVVSATDLQVLNVLGYAFVSTLKRNDFNGDGVSDVLWRNTGTGVAAIWDMNAAGGHTAVGIGTLASAVQVAAVGDFNGDGIADILWRNTSTGAASVWDMNASDGHKAVNLGTVATTWQVAGVGYFNGDGVSDILWRNTSTGVAAIWDMNVSGGHTAVGIGSVASAVQIAGVGDFNGDGVCDILWRNTSTGAASVWDMDASGGNTAVSIGTVATTWQIADVGNFNGDGIADILWRNTSTGVVVIWDMKASGGHTAVGIGTVASAVQIAGVGDFNGDGIADILWRNTSTGAASVWDMNASGGHKTVNLGIVATNWQASA